MRVLVTGNLGYIGPVIVRRLQAEGHYVIGWDLGLFVHEYAEMPVWPDKQRFLDIRDASLWHETVDAVVHLAGLSNDPMGDLDPELTEKINVGGTLKVVQLTNARHVIVSSCSVYGATSEVATEETEPNPLSVYAEGKALVDQAVLARARVDRSLNALSLRLGTVYGYSPGHRLDLVVNRMVHDAANKGVVTATGNAARPLVHVEDVADAVAYFLPRGETGIYNIKAENYRMHDLARAIGNYAGVPIDLRPSGADARDYMASSAKAYLAGWRPSRSVETSLPVLFERTFNLPPGRYERLPVLRRVMDSGRLDAHLYPPSRIAA